MKEKQKLGKAELAHWAANLPQDPITPEIEKVIEETIREVRAERRLKTSPVAPTKHQTKSP